MVTRNDESQCSQGRRTTLPRSLLAVVLCRAGATCRPRRDLPGFGDLVVGDAEYRDLVDAERTPTRSRATCVVAIHHAGGRHAWDVGQSERAIRDAAGEF